MNYNFIILNTIYIHVDITFGILFIHNIIIVFYNIILQFWLKYAKGSVLL